MKRILIVGASGGIGLATTRVGLERGHHVRAFARSAGRIAIEHERLERFAGDARNAHDVRRALDGIDAVIQTLGVAMGPKLVIGPIDLFSSATEILLPAMQQAGVRRLIAVTGFGAGESRAAIGPLQRIGFNLVFGRAYADKDIQERLIVASGLDWVIVRPGVLTNAAATGRYRVLRDPGEWRNGFIARADVADFLVQQVERDDWLRQAAVLVT